MSCQPFAEDSVFMLGWWRQSYRVRTTVTAFPDQNWMRVLGSGIRCMGTRTRVLPKLLKLDLQYRSCRILIRKIIFFL